MKSHPVEYKEKYGVDPKVIQALNVPNPRYKRPYHRKAIQRLDGDKTDHRTSENQTPKQKMQQKIEKDKLKKKLDSLVIETPRPTLPKSKKDRLRPMPPHLLKKEMEAQEARERAEKERIVEEEAERIRLEKEEEKRLEREEEEKRINTTQEKASPEKVITDLPMETQKPVEQQPADDDSNNKRGEEQVSEQSEISSTDNGENADVGKPLFVVPLFNNNQASIVVNNSQPDQAQTTDIPTNILPQSSEPPKTELPKSQNFSDRKALETTTIDLSQLKEVTTPIIEEVLHKSPFKIVEQSTDQKSIETTTVASENVAEESVQESDMDLGHATEKMVETSRSSTPSEKQLSRVESPSDSETDDKNSTSVPKTVNAQPGTNRGSSCNTPKKSTGKSKKPRTPKSAEPSHRILTRRKYAHDEEARFKAEKEAALREDAENEQHEARQEESMQFEHVSSTENGKSEAMEVSSCSKENEVASVGDDREVTGCDVDQTDRISEVTSTVTSNNELETNDVASVDDDREVTGCDVDQTDRISEVTSTVTNNNELETNDSVDGQSIPSEGVNSVVSMDTNKTSSEDDGLETMETESQKSAQIEQHNENEQSVKSDGQSEDGLETIVIILKESEGNSKITGTTEKHDVSDSLENNSIQSNSIEDWIDKTEGKEETRSRKGKHLREMSNEMADHVDEEPLALRRSTRSNEQKQCENQQTENLRVLRKRTTVKDDAVKDVKNRNTERKLRSPQKETSAGRTLRRRLSPASQERKDSRSKSIENSKEKRDIEFKLKKCTISLVDNVLPKGKLKDHKNKMARDISVDSENNTGFRSRLRRRLSTESADDGHKRDLVDKHDVENVNKRTLRRRTSTESVGSRDSNIKPTELAVIRGRVLRRRLSANSLDGSLRSRSSSCPRRANDTDKTKRNQQEKTKSARQLRKRLSPHKDREVANAPGRLLRRRNSHSEGKKETSIEREGKRRLRSSRSSSWEEQAKVLAKCSVKLLRCDTPVKQLDTDGKEQGGGNNTKSIDVDVSRKKTPSEHSYEIITDSTEVEDAEKDPLQSVLEKETELVLNHIQREKETRAAAERKAQEEAANIEEASEKESLDTTSLDMVSVASEMSINQTNDESDVCKQNNSQSYKALPPESQVEPEATTTTSRTEEEDKSSKETSEAQEVKQNKESRKPKKSRSRKKHEGNNIYELLRQQKDKIQTKVLGKANNEISPKEKRSSPDSSKKSSPDSEKASPESRKFSLESSASPEHISRSKKARKGKRKNEDRIEININHEDIVADESHVEKEIGIIIPLENTSPAKTSPAKQKSPNKFKKAEESKEKNDVDSDENEDFRQLLELGTGRTLRSEVSKSPDKIMNTYSSNLRQKASDFEKAIHLSLMEAHKSRKGKKKKKKHKRDKRDSSPFSLRESCDHSVKPKKKKKKKHKHRDRSKDSPKEEKLLDLSEEQVELLEQSFELMMPDLFRQLTIESPTGTDGDQPFSVLANMESKSKKDKNQSPSHNKQSMHKKIHESKSPTRENKSPRTDDKKSPQTNNKTDKIESASKPKPKSNTQSPKSPKSKKPETPPRSKSSGAKSSPEIPEELTRTTRAKLARTQAIEFQKQIEQSNTHAPTKNKKSKLTYRDTETVDRKAKRKTEKEKLTTKDAQRHNKDREDDHNKQDNKELHKKSTDKSNNSKGDTNRDKNRDKRDKHEKRRDYEKRPRSENLFLQDISQTPKFFEHNIPLSNSLSQVPPTVAQIASVQFSTLTDPSRKRGLDSLLHHGEPPAKIPTLENDIINCAPPPKRKRGRPPKTSKLNNNAPPTPTPTLISSSNVSLASHVSPVFSHALGPSVFGSTSNVETAVASQPKEKSTKKGKKRKRSSSGRIEIRGQEIVYMEEKDSTSENSLGADAGNGPVIGQLEIKQEVESSEAEDTCTGMYAQPAEAEEGREVIMVSVATMTDSSYLMDLRKLMLEQEQMEAEAAAAAVTSPEPERESEKKESNSPRLTVKLYRCDYCTRPFTQRSWMVLHKLREHGYSCQSQAIYMHTLSRRVMRRVLIEWRRYGCETCNRRFNHKAHYIFHQSTEHRRKQYRCGVCNLSSDSYMLYQMHAVFVHKAVMMK